MRKWCQVSNAMLSESSSLVVCRGLDKQWLASSSSWGSWFTETVYLRTLDSSEKSVLFHSVFVLPSEPGRAPYTALTPIRHDLSQQERTNVMVFYENYCFKADRLSVFLWVFVLFCFYWFLIQVREHWEIEFKFEDCWVNTESEKWKLHGLRRGHSHPVAKRGEAFLFSEGLWLPI